MQSKDRAALRRKLDRLARRMIFGTLAESLRRCGQPGCRCHHGGPKHGPHLQMTYRGPDGKTWGYHVPAMIAGSVREGVAAWHEFLEVARALAELNRQRVWAPHLKRSGRR